MSDPVIEPLAVVLERFERAYLVAALRAHGGKKAATASTLGVSRKSLWQKMRGYEIGAGEIRPVVVVPEPSTDTPKCARKGEALAKAERAVLEAASVLAEEIEQAIDPDDEEPVALVAAVKAWRAAQAQHATAVVEALAGVPS